MRWVTLRSPTLQTDTDQTLPRKDTSQRERMLIAMRTPIAEVAPLDFAT